MSFAHPLLAAALATLAAVAQAAPPPRALTAAEVFSKVAPSVWHVRTYDRDGLRLRQGSAVVIDQRTVVTNCHVLYRSSRIVLSQGKQLVEAKLRMWDTARDLCELRAAQLDAPAVELASMPQLAVGQTAYAVGSPLGLEQTLSNGLISSLRKDDEGRLERVQTTAPISSGSSGGGLFDERGRLIGITSSSLQSGSSDVTAQNLNFAIPSSFWIELPPRHEAARKKIEAGTPDPLAQALEMPEPSVAFKPTVTMPANPARWALTLNDRVPFLNDTKQQRFRGDFLSAPLPRAFAISDNGFLGVASGTTRDDPVGIADPQERALAFCRQVANKPCVIYAVDNEVLYQPPPGAPAAR